MKKLLIYYFVIFAPLILLIYAGNRSLISSTGFVILLFSYCFIYRGFTDYYRLRSKNIRIDNLYRTLLFPGLQLKYFTELYFI